MTWRERRDAQREKDEREAAEYEAFLRRDAESAEQRTSEREVAHMGQWVGAPIAGETKKRHWWRWVLAAIIVAVALDVAQDLTSINSASREPWGPAEHTTFTTMWDERLPLGVFQSDWHDIGECVFSWASLHYPSFAAFNDVFEQPGGIDAQSAQDDVQAFTRAVLECRQTVTGS